MITLGLERITLLLKDVPLSWRAVHVAGTNGKGSICAYVAAVLQAANVRTGRFTSPHFIDRWDGICVNGQPVAEALFHEVEEGVKWKNEKNAINASDFEILTATAFEVFNREKVQVGVVEVGMGGLLDATNVLERPLVTVISQIGLDHQAFLGNTLPEIALQKAGIMKPGVPCVVDGHNDETVLRIFKEYAELQHAEIIIAPTSEKSIHEDEDATVFSDGQGSNDFTQGTATSRNMWCAYKALQYAMPQISTSKDYDPQILKSEPSGELIRSLIGEGHMKRGSLPGRFQSISLKPLAAREEHVLMDGAHNEDAWIVLGEYIDHHIRPTSTDPITWVFSLSGGRKPDAFISNCWKSGDNLITVEFGAVEGMPWVEPTRSSELVDDFKAAETDIAKAVACGRDVAGAIRSAAEIAKGGPLVITGSLYLISDVLRALRATSGNAAM